MPNPNAIVATSIQIEPPLQPDSGDLAGQIGDLSIVFDRERRVRLDPADRRSVGFVRVLESLRSSNLPAYAEVDPATGFLVRVLVPLVGRVAGLERTDDGLSLTFEPSHARHLLRPDNPDVADLEKEARDALERHDLVILSEDDAHDIIDIRRYMPDPDGPFPPLPPGPAPKRPRPTDGPGPFAPIRRLFRRFWDWIVDLIHWFRCLTPARAQSVFDSMAATICTPSTIPPPCIPFNYPDDGCWARAHEMCRLMIGMGLSPRKIWIDGSLHVSTKNHPECSVNWGWHVAPTLCVRGKYFPKRRPMVIDPSLFTTPVTTTTWKGVQGDPGAVLTETGQEQFWHGGGQDPGYASTNYYLNVYRIALQTRANQFGPPPYANCP